VRGQGRNDDGGRKIFPGLADLLQHLLAAHDGHHEIEQDDVGTPLRVEVEGFPAIFGKPLFEYFAGDVIVVELPAETVVFRDQDLQIVHGSRPHV